MEVGGGDEGVHETKQLESDLAPPYEGPSHPTNTRQQINLILRRFLNIPPPPPLLNAFHVHVSSKSS